MKNTTSLIIQVIGFKGKSPYQQRRDGVEREYFFAYKVSGGSSAPGIKMFVAENMQSIENTDTKFEPKYQIELSKAEEMPENRYMFDPNRPTQAPGSRLSSGFQKPRISNSYSSGIKYIYKCAYCGKQSIKTSMDSTQVRSN